MRTYTARHARVGEDSPERRMLMRGSVAGAAVTLAGAAFAAPASAARPILKVGSRGTSVKGLQQRLTKGGYRPGAADGIFGSRTRAAVIKLQGDHRLVKDGVVGPKTWAVVLALGGSTPPKPNPKPGKKPMLKTGSRGTAVKQLQTKLLQQGFWHSGSDGVYGETTQQAVMAVQKVYGLSRDGVCGPQTWAVVDRLSRPGCRTTSGHAIEVDLSRQVLKLVLNGKTSWVFNTSTGSGKRYYSQGSWRTAVTPKGRFRVFRRVNGNDVGPLGALWRPIYFNGGIAVHGYSSVPGYAASHGCCRVSNTAMNTIWANNWMPHNRIVWVY